MILKTHWLERIRASYKRKHSVAMALIFSPPSLTNTGRSYIASCGILLVRSVSARSRQLCLLATLWRRVELLASCWYYGRRLTALSSTLFIYAMSIDTLSTTMQMWVQLWWCVLDRLSRNGPCYGLCFCHDARIWQHYVAVCELCLVGNWRAVLVARLFLVFTVGMELL